MVAGKALWHMFLYQCLQSGGRPTIAFRSPSILNEPPRLLQGYTTPTRCSTAILSANPTLSGRSNQIEARTEQCLSFCTSSRLLQRDPSHAPIELRSDPKNELRGTVDVAKKVRSSFPKPYGLSLGRYRRVLRREKYNRRLESNSQLNNGILKAKGSWSYDWRVALEILRQSLPSPRENQPGLVDDDPYRSAKHDYIQESPEIGSFTSTKATTGGQSIASYHYTQTAPPNGYTGRFWGREAWMNEDRRSFLKTVHDLTTRSTPRVLQRFRYSLDSPMSHFHSRYAEKNYIRDSIISKFQDPENRHLLSIEAFSVAISFFCRKNLLRDARTLLNLMDEVKISPDAKVYNHFLRAASSVKDLGNFTSILKSMVGRNIRPDPYTWLSFIFALESDVVKIKVAALMFDLGLVQEEWVLQRLAISQVEIALQKHVKSMGSFEDFIKQLDTQYGDKWLTVRSGSKICNRLCRAGLSLDAEEMLKIMSQRDVLPNNTTLSAFLSLSLKSQDRRHALHYLSLFKQEYGILPDSVYEFSLLFRLGWQTKSSNMCRLVWTVACTKAKVSGAVQRAVFRSLTDNFTCDSGTSGQRWQREAGKIILGSGFVLRGNQKDHEMPDRKLIIQKISDELRPGEFINSVHTLAKQVFTEDITASGRYYYKGDFVDEFRQAVEKDEREPWGAQVYQQIAVKISNTMKPTFARRPGMERETYIPASLFEEAQVSLDSLDQEKATSICSPNLVPRLSTQARFQ